ncbi:MAG: acetyl-CoA carboxylase biotin carboxylase subunit, partial [Bacteroidales bacterium]|nr:acetyl-CoA carboxylase biotin carboxylase subunit [Bacteroidales bacterium]
RECSVQRRHQKVVEETPSTLMTDALRKKMGEQAVLAAKAVNYVGAGTIEFLVDDDLNYYFLEMNTRLQVEHPITEMTSGLDLVKEQLKIAFGHKLEHKQEDIKQNGHSIEVRIYAEDPENNFMPSPGKVLYIKQPSGNGIRVDGYVYTGFNIPINYDPMIAKLIVWGLNRNEAIERMKRALLEYRILGLKHNIPYLFKIFKHPKFIEGKYDTRFIELYGEDLKQTKTKNDKKIDAAAIAVFIDYYNNALSNTPNINSNNHSNWKNAGRLK